MKITNLSFSYQDKLVLDKLNLEIGENITCLMGASGIGKTTLLKLIAGLLESPQGSIEHEYHKVAFLFQEDRLLPWLNVYDNLKLVCDDDEEIQKMLKHLEIDPHLKINELSGGMARRVSLARCLLFDGDLLLLDEPFKGMDEKLIEKVAQLIIRQNKTTIVATHSMKEAELLHAEVINLL